MKNSIAGSFKFETNLFRQLDVSKVSVMSFHVQISQYIKYLTAFPAVWLLSYFLQDATLTKTLDSVHRLARLALSNLEHPLSWVSAIDEIGTGFSLLDLHFC